MVGFPDSYVDDLPFPVDSPPDMPLPCTANVDEDIRVERARRAIRYQMAASNHRLRAIQYRRASEDVFYWLGNFCWTFDAKRSRKHRTARVPFLLWPYVYDVAAMWLGLDGLTDSIGELQPVVMAKSREMGGSKIPMAVAIWDWQFNDDVDYGFISRVERDVDNNKDTGRGSLFSFARWLIRQQPKWMRPSGWRGIKRHRNDDTWLELINRKPNGVSNTMIGSSTVVDAMRGLRRKRVMGDEANSFADYEDLLAAFTDIGPPWMVSSVGGRHTGFARSYFGDMGFPVYDLADAGGRDGWIRYRLHYSARPDRDPTTEQGARWVRAKKAQRTPEQWAREQEIDFLASMPGRIWGDAFSEDDNLVSDRSFWAENVSQYLEHATLIEGWDFGSGASLTAVVWAAYFEDDDCLYVLDYRQWQQATPEAVAQGVADAGWRCNRNPTGRLPHMRVGDIAGRRRRAGSIGGRPAAVQASWIDNLFAEGIDITGQSMPVEPAIELVRRKLSERHIFLSWRCAIQRGGLPSLVQTVQSYRRNVKSSNPNDWVGDSPKPLKDVHSHAADALQHVATTCWQPKSGTEPVRYQL